MARHLSSPADTAPIEAYLAEVAHRLHGPRQRRARILAELHDGLQQAAEDHLAAGFPETAAAKAAVAGFGSPQAVADGFAGELATAYARRIIAVYLATGPLVGIWWLLLLQPYPWRAGLIALLAAIPVIPMIAIIVGVAAATLATTGSLIRWLPETRPRRALTLTLAIAVLVFGADLTVLSIFLSSGVPMQTLSALACTASLIRIACGGMVVRRTMAIRRKLGPASPSRMDDRDAHR